MAAGGEVAVDRQLNGVEPQLLQAAGLARRERLVDHVGQRRPPPQRQRLAGGAVGQQPLEPPHIHLAVCEAQLVAAPARNDLRAPTGRGQRLAQLRDVDLQHLRSSGRRLLSPQSLNEPVTRHRGAGMEGQHRQQRARLSSAESHRASLDAHLQGSQDADVHLAC